MQTCPDCHALVEDQLKYCDNCGFRLLPEEKEPHSWGEKHFPWGEEHSPWGEEHSPLGEEHSPLGEEHSPLGEEPPAPAVEVKKPLEHPGEGGQPAPQGACSACGYINLPGETFCNNCGVQLAPVVSVPPPPPVPVPTPMEDFSKPAAPSEIPPPGVCTYCGHSNEPGETFCMNCGLQLSSTGVVSDIPPPQPIQVETPSPPPAIIPPESTPEPPVEVAPASDLGAAWGKLIVGETGAEIFLPAGKSELLIGRSDPVRNIFPDVDLTPYGGELNGVSRMHAKLEMKGSEKTIEDLNSTNFTFLNRQKLEPGQQYPVHFGDEIRLGLLRLEYRVEK